MGGVGFNGAEGRITGIAAASVVLGGVGADQASVWLDEGNACELAACVDAEMLPTLAEGTGPAEAETELVTSSRDGAMACASAVSDEERQLARTRQPATSEVRMERRMTGTLDAIQDKQARPVKDDRKS
jgi:hypothetical protein